MKYIANNKMYVEVYDLNCIFKYGLKVPRTIFQKGLHDVLHINKDNIHNYIEFTDQEDIDYIKDQSYILDYDSTMNLTDEELQERILVEEKIIDHLLQTIKFRRKYIDLVKYRQQYKKELYVYRTLIRVKRYRELIKQNNNEMTKRNK